MAIARNCELGGTLWAVMPDLPNVRSPSVINHHAPRFLTVVLLGSVDSENKMTKGHYHLETAVNRGTTSEFWAPEG
jgi:hypothetical protein